MPRSSILTPGLLLFTLACGGASQPESAQAPDVPEQCRNVHVDRLEGDWIAVKGQQADPKTRVRIRKGSDGDYEAWFVGGFFQRRTLVGVKRGEDVQFTEVPDARKKRAVEAGEETLVRMYLKPELKACAVKAFVGTLDSKGREQIPPTGFEFVTFPRQEGVTFAFQPPTAQLFLGEAAVDRKKAEAQLAELGGPEVSHEMGQVPVGMWSSVEADGHPDCVYDMDLYFDDQRLEDQVRLPAGEVKDGMRHWFHTFEAPYSGNHHFELHRFRTCPGAERQLVEVASIEAVLM